MSDETLHPTIMHMLLYNSNAHCSTKLCAFCWSWVKNDCAFCPEAFNSIMFKLFKTLTNPAQGYVDAGGDFKQVLYSNLGCALSSVYNFTRKVDQYSKDFNLFLEERIPTKEWGIYQQIAKIDSLEAYKEWDIKMGSYFESKRLTDFTNTSLDSFFD